MARRTLSAPLGEKLRHETLPFSDTLHFDGYRIHGLLEPLESLVPFTRHR
jgi:hypothetical protein